MFDQETEALLEGREVCLDHRGSGKSWVLEPGCLDLNPAFPT
jgi:hypothetical protein